MKPTEIVAKLLANPTDLDLVKELVAEDATYVSLNYHNPDLTSIEPWCGTHLHAGPSAIHETFVAVGQYWDILAFDIYVIFSGTADTTLTFDKHGPEGDNPDETNVAVFGRFRYRSKTLGRVTDTPFGVLSKVDEKRQKVTYMQFVEDTLDTAASFRKRGTMVYASDPKGGEVVIGDEL